MKNFASFSAKLAVLVLMATAAAHAQAGGCQDSPENPTLVLAGLASGAFGVSQLRQRIRARRKSQK
jgi:XrtJ-associated TM-motif-TM protein